MNDFLNHINTINALKQYKILKSWDLVELFVSLYDLAPQSQSEHDFMLQKDLYSRYLDFLNRNDIKFEDLRKQQIFRLFSRFGVRRVAPKKNNRYAIYRIRKGIKWD